MENLGTAMVFVALFLITFGCVIGSFFIGSIIDKILPLRILLVPVLWYMSIILLCLLLKQPQLVDGLDFRTHHWQLLLPICFLLIPYVNSVIIAGGTAVGLLGTYVVILSLF